MKNIENYICFGDSFISDDIKNTILSALMMIANVDSGKKLIIDAASKVDGNKIIIDFYNGVPTLATDRGIILGTIYPQGKYLGIDGEYHNISLIRILFYELLHLGLYSSMKKKIQKIKDGELTYKDFIIEEYEPEALYTTNQFMHQFFDEIPRSDFNHSDMIENSPPWASSRS